MSQSEILNQICKNSSIDVWSFGAILVEILSGVPNWLSYKCLLPDNNSLKMGLFA